MNNIKVRGGNIFNIKDGFVVSDNGGWLSGKYDSIESAKLALKNKSKDNWCYLDSLRDSINIREKRNIKVSDFK